MGHIGIYYCLWHKSSFFYHFCLQPGLKLNLLSIFLSQNIFQIWHSLSTIAQKVKSNKFYMKLQSDVNLKKTVFPPFFFLLKNINGGTSTCVFLTQWYGGTGTSGFLKFKEQITMMFFFEFRFSLVFYLITYQRL